LIRTPIFQGSKSLYLFIFMSSSIVSVIIPTFNRKTLLRALGSALQQSIGLKSVEVIVVNDFSTDNTRELMEGLVSAFPQNIKLINNLKNSGPGNSRNAGIDAAKGDYLLFLDSDDFLTQNSLEKMVLCAEENLSDIVLGKKNNLDGTTHAPGSTAKTVLKASIYNAPLMHTIGPASKLFRSEFIRKNNIRFSENRKWGEDQPFVIKSYFTASNISILADDIYLYLDSDELSLTRVVNNYLDRVVTTAEVCSIIKEYSNKNMDTSGVVAHVFCANLLPVISSLVVEPDIDARLFQSVKTLLESYFTKNVILRLTPQLRNAFEPLIEYIDSRSS